ncbi:MAG: glycine--tRNA ligase subunit beta [Alphaproteobacteria bacterium]
MADLLLELFSEEIPARMQADALAHLQRELESKLGAKSQGFVTPRRVAAIVSNLPAVQPDINTELKGPKVGAPEAAMQGFLKKSGMKLEDLQQVDGVYVAKIHQKGKPTAEILKPAIEEILKTFPWPKSMRWGANETSWVRPLHSILCIFDGKIVPVEFAGVKAGNITRGHRFLAPATIEIKDPAEYETKLEKAFVIADREKRKAKILDAAQKAAASHSLKLKEDIGLLEEVTGLVEWPVLLAGKIDASYMDLPPEVLVSEMRAHQKYFALHKADGSLSDTFLITSNMETADKGKAIIAGNERVLRARLADGRFFWDTDRKKRPEDWSQDLRQVTYHAKLGSMWDKVVRIETLAPQIAKHVPKALDDLGAVNRSAELCKFDLVTGMVGEFPELQGVMGRYYEMHHYGQIENSQSWVIGSAIRDHYLPLGPSSPVPTAPVSICVALADKLDTLISMFAIGEKPTGSKDPFALRRAALGVIRIVLENNIRLPLLPLLKAAPLKEIALHAAHEKLEKKVDAQLHEAAPGKVGKYLSVNESACEDIPEGKHEEIAQSLLAFFHDRLIVQLKDQGIRHDVIKAVITNGDDDLVRIVNRAKAVQAFLDTDDGRNLLAGYKRAANILSIEEKKDITRYNREDIDESLFIEAAEKALRLPYSPKQNEELWEYISTEQYTKVMQWLATLRKPMDNFFDHVMVNVEDRKVRANRLRLLASIRDCMNEIADFSKIEGDVKEQKKAA